MSDLERALERARAIAVALEQENARLTEERDRLLRDLVHESDPWANVVVPEDWEVDE